MNRKKHHSPAGAEEFENLCKSLSLMALALNDARNALTDIASGQCPDAALSARKTIMNIAARQERRLTP